MFYMNLYIINSSHGHNQMFPTHVLIHPQCRGWGITIRRTGLENGMENRTENGLVEDLTVICLSK